MPPNMTIACRDSSNATPSLILIEGQLLQGCTRGAGVMGAEGEGDVRAGLADATGLASAVGAPVRPAAPGELQPAATSRASATIAHFMPDLTSQWRATLSVASMFRPHYTPLTHGSPTPSAQR